MSKAQSLFEIVVKICPWYIDDAEEVIEEMLERFPAMTYIHIDAIVGKILVELGVQQDEAIEKVGYWMPKLRQEAKDNIKDVVEVLMVEINEGAFVLGNIAMAQGVTSLVENSIQYCGPWYTSDVLDGAFKHMEDCADDDT